MKSNKLVRLEAELALMKGSDKMNEVGKCLEHPMCKAWVVWKGQKVCYECWNESRKPK